MKKRGLGSGSISTAGVAAVGRRCLLPCSGPLLDASLTAAGVSLAAAPAGRGSVAAAASRTLAGAAWAASSRRCEPPYPHCWGRRPLGPRPRRCGVPQPPPPLGASGLAPPLGASGRATLAAPGTAAGSLLGCCREQGRRVLFPQFDPTSVTPLD